MCVSWYLIYNENLLLLSWDQNLPKIAILVQKSGKFIFKDFYIYYISRQKCVSVFSMNKACTPPDPQAPYRLAHRSYSTFCCHLRQSAGDGLDLALHLLVSQETATHQKPLFPMETGASCLVKYIGGSNTHERALHGHYCGVWSWTRVSLEFQFLQSFWTSQAHQFASGEGSCARIHSL